MKRRGSARWNGLLKDGTGWVATESGVLNETQYSFKSRFVDGHGTNPEELIGAAHAGCFSMAFSGVLEKAGFKPESIDSIATVSLDNRDGNWTITASHLTVEAVVPGIEDDRFQALAEEAKVNCPVSRLLNAELSVDATLILESRAEASSITASQSPAH